MSIHQRKSPVKRRILCCERNYCKLETEVVGELETLYKAGDEIMFMRAHQMNLMGKDI